MVFGWLKFGKLFLTLSWLYRFIRLRIVVLWIDRLHHLKIMDYYEKIKIRWILQQTKLTLLNIEVWFLDGKNTKTWLFFLF